MRIPVTEKYERFGWTSVERPDLPRPRALLFVAHIMLAFPNFSVSLFPAHLRLKNVPELLPKPGDQSSCPQFQWQGCAL